MDMGKPKRREASALLFMPPLLQYLLPLFMATLVAYLNFLWIFIFFIILFVYFYSILTFLGKYTLPRASPSIDLREKAIIRPHRRPKKASIPYREPLLP